MAHKVVEVPSKPDYAVFIDFLAFTTSMTAFKDMHTYQEKGFNWRKYPILPEPQHYQGSNFNNDQLSLTPEQTDLYLSDLYQCYFDRMKLFIADFFGLSVGVPRGRGGHFYENSASLYSYESCSEPFGTIYFGGNKDTVYIQITGKGCAHVFSYTTAKRIHNILNHLDITTLKRLDLATDDYHGIYTCNAAIAAYKDEAFYIGRGPKPQVEISSAIDSDGQPTKEIITVGSRQSRIYWRVYNKALEQKVSGIWFRSEVEMKSIGIETLLNISGTYTGICAYSQQINPTEPAPIPAQIGRKAVDSLEHSLRWIRNQGSKTLSKVFHLVKGDLTQFVSLIIKEQHLTDLNLNFDMPVKYQEIIREKLKINNTVPF